ncbi:MAG: aminodeoxychorismate synthase component I [Bacteroidales bacterium]|nr:aminodeoxychorismate synthase component I [Bacteroidales bacterium]
MGPSGFERMNELGSQSQPFLFILDFDLLNPLVFTPIEAQEAGILYQIHNRKNFTPPPPSVSPFSFLKTPVLPVCYRDAFNLVMHHLKAGNSYLVNLTFPTRIETSLSLRDIFFRSKARYKILLPEQFVVFSPEIFIRIEERIISSNPMKGTIDTTVPNARSVLLSNPKELAEHHTIVDLIRNDLNSVAKEVRVERFRYIEEIDTNFKHLLQVSSRITGILPPDYTSHLGDILFKVLPAGSVTGAPKKRTIEIIHEAETYHRGYYTGVMGYFDGSDLDSGVMIRFIEETSDGKVYKSGGGITSQSVVNEEYREMIDKVYVPFT